MFFSRNLFFFVYVASLLGRARCSTILVFLFVRQLKKLNNVSLLLVIEIRKMVKRLTECFMKVSKRRDKRLTHDVPVSRNVRFHLHTVREIHK